MASEPVPTRVFSAPYERAEPDRRGALRWITLSCAGLAGLGATVGLVGWVLDEPTLERIAPGLATMKFNTALALLLLAVGFALPSRDVLLCRLAAACAVLAGVISAVQLMEYTVHAELGIDQLIVTDRGGEPHPGRTSISAAACLLALAGACVLSGSGDWSRRVRQALAVCALASSGMALLGYAYGVESLYTLGPFAKITLHTAAALLLLSLAALATTPDGVLEWTLFGPDAGAELSRRLGPLAVLGLPFIGFVCITSYRRGWLDGVTAVALTVLLCTVASALATWMSAVRIARVDSMREATLRDLADLRTSLELQVTARAEQLRSRHDQIAVLEDRQRIAADIHDVVIQRLFAAGMFLQGTPVGDPAVQGRIDTATESLDAAIKDLRTSIFALGGHAGRTLDLGTAFDEVCTDAARLLGFRADVTVDDPDDEAETVRDDLLAVLRESLSNVARHARASRVAVVLRSGNGLIGLTVTDDGVGMTVSPHSSGTRNMAERARQHGGDCVWTTVSPHGTRVWWYVPGTPVLGPAAAGQPASAGREASAPHWDHDPA